MEQYVIKGGNPLVGEVEIGGAKNAALGILAAAIMTDDIPKTPIGIPCRQIACVNLRMVKPDSSWQ